jgi:hypothetical protein
VSRYFDHYTEQEVEIGPPEADGRVLVTFPEYRIAPTGYFDPHGAVFLDRFEPLAEDAGTDAAYIAWEDAQVAEHERWLATQGGEGSDTRWRDVTDLTDIWEAQACPWCGMSKESH